MPRKQPANIRLRAPQLDDEAVVEIHEFLEDLMTRFENRYFAQLHRSREDRKQTHPNQPELTLDDGTPF